MESGDDESVLKHLLDLEAEAAALVEGAQAEAERRVLEGEKVCRARYDETYSAEAAGLQAVYDNQISSFKEDYKKQLETFRNSLNEMPVNKKQFSALAERLFLGDGTSPPGEL
jgi:regulator of protease activity HflC (stomatin/prohibitin superfamily)